MVKVKFFTLLRLRTGIDEIDVDTDQIRLFDLLFKVKEQIASDVVIKKLLEDDGSLRRGTIILVNGKNISTMDHLETVIQADDVVGLFPPGGGG